MAKTILFLALARGSPTIEEQRLACAAPDDLIVEAGRLSLAELAERLVHKDAGFAPGDTLKIYDLGCIGIATSTLVRVLVKTLAAGVSIEICRPGITIVPGEDPTQTVRLLEALDAHWRGVHGTKTKDGAKAKLGRKPRLLDEQLPEIRSRLGKPGATTTIVARELQVGRSTLFDFLSRHGVSATQS